MSTSSTQTSAVALSRRDAITLAALGAAAAALPTLALGQSGSAQAGKGASGAPSGAASLEGPQPADFARLKIGELTAVLLSDGFGKLGPIGQFFAPEATAADRDRVLTKAHHPLDVATVELNILCLQIGSERVLIDAGSGGGMGPTTGRLIDNMRAAGIAPESITGVVYTHLHGEHLAGAVRADGSQVFPNARHFIVKAEYEYWTGNPVDMRDTGLPPEARSGMVASIQKNLAAIKDKIEIVAPGDKVFPRIQIIATHGHTPGHASYMIDGGSEQLAVLGDLAHSHVLAFARPDWTIIFDVDRKQAVASRKAMFDRLSSDGTLVAAYHMPWPGLGRVAREGEGYRWDIAPTRR
ncbi:MAG: MBL fold metallo-hydrolase [Planctomyces sp.]